MKTLKQRTIGSAVITWGSEQFTDNKVTVDGVEVGNLLLTTEKRMVLNVITPLDSYQVQAALHLMRMIEQRLGEGTL